MISEIFTLCASNTQHLASHSCVFNQSQIEDTLYVRVPYNVCTQNELRSVEEISDEPVTSSPDILQDVVYMRYRPWVDIKSSALNMNPGHHVYKLHFVNRYTEVCSNLFFAYTVQQDNPDKPYIYMKRNAEEEKQT